MQPHAPISSRTARIAWAAVGGFCVLVIVGGGLGLMWWFTSRTVGGAIIREPELDQPGQYSYISGVSLETGEPLMFSSCRPVEYAVDVASAPPGGAEAVEAAFRRIDELSPLTFRPVGEGEHTQGGRTPSRINVVWVSVGSFGYAGIDGSTLAFAEPQRVVTKRGERLGKGEVRLDSGWFLSFSGEGGAGRQAMRAVAMHEIGHVLGLGHVADENELMNSYFSGVIDFGPGDRRGLERLGEGPCV